MICFSEGYGEYVSVKVVSHKVLNIILDFIYSFLYFGICCQFHSQKRSKLCEVIKFSLCCSLYMKCLNKEKQCYYVFFN